MAVSITTGNKFCLHFRKLFPKERVSLDSIMKDRAYAKKMASMVLGQSTTPEMKLACDSLMSELGSAPAQAAGSAVSAAPDLSQWEKLAECARAVGGPIAGAMVSKFRKERPEATLGDAKIEFASKLGAKFMGECSARGL